MYSRGGGIFGKGGGTTFGAGGGAAALPPGTLPSGALPSGALPSGTLPSGTLPRGTLTSGTFPGGMPSGACGVSGAGARSTLSRQVGQVCCRWNHNRRHAAWNMWLQGSFFAPIDINSELIYIEIIQITTHSNHFVDILLHKLSFVKKLYYIKKNNR